ncbi:hypothetical protein YC2023_013299 [Brassica napus]
MGTKQLLCFLETPLMMDNYVKDDGNFILELDVGMKNGCIDLGFEDQPDTVTFSEGYQDISRNGIKQEGCESGVWHYNIRMRPNIATEKGPNSLYCLGVRLTTYIQSSQKEATIVVSKLTENNLCRLFSNNIVATSVVVNSTALNSNAPTRVIFLLLTKEINYAAMKSWFAMNLDSIQIFEDFKWFNASYVPVFKQLQESDTHIYYFSSHNDNGRRQSKFRNPKYIMKCNIPQSQLKDL